MSHVKFRLFFPAVRYNILKCVGKVKKPCTNTKSGTRTPHTADGRDLQFDILHYGICLYCLFTTHVSSNDLQNIILSTYFAMFNDERRKSIFSEIIIVNID